MTSRIPEHDSIACLPPISTLCCQMLLTNCHVGGCGCDSLISVECTLGSVELGTFCGHDLVSGIPLMEFMKARDLYYC